MCEAQKSINRIRILSKVYYDERLREIVISMINKTCNGEGKDIGDEEFDDILSIIGFNEFEKGLFIPFYKDRWAMCAKEHRQIMFFVHQAVSLTVRYYEALL